MKGVVIENSLADTSILSQLDIEKTWQDGEWKLHAVKVTENQIPLLSESLNDGPWYIHLWEPGKDDIQVIFKGKVITIKAKDKASWEPAITYGKSIGILEEQLDFLID